MNKLVYCNECKENFKIKAKKKKYSKGIEEIYFICPHCKRRYTSYYTNPIIRMIQLDIRETRKERYAALQEAAFKDDKEYKRVLKLYEDKLNKLDRQYVSSSNKLKKKMDEKFMR